MLKTVARWLKIYEEELGLFLWIAALLFLVRAAGMILNNYAETAFLKRFGVEYLPIVNMLNAVATFFIMGFVTAFMNKIQGSRLLFYLFFFCGITMAAFRFLIPLGFDLIYPVLFMLRAQFEVLQALLFWNMANDFFNMRQTKRLFPLISAGGVMGLIAGSFCTPLLAKYFYFDNLLFVYLGICLAGAIVVKSMRTLFPNLLMADKSAQAIKSKTSMLEEIKKILPLIKESVLVKIMLLLTFMPNVVIPIMNYQFSFAVNAQFATEAGMLQFFSYFRGVLNIISLVILLFVGRIFGRWGLPVALMFHPFNYILAFMAFLLKFDYLAAIYARMTTNILRTTINIPASAILMGLFPESYRGMVRPFLRGTVVRMGLFVGSGLILASESLFHPRYLSLVALPFVAAWIAGPIILKKRYASILLDLVSRKVIDLKSMEAKDVGQLFRDKKIRDQLLSGFENASGADCLWYARLLKSLLPKELDARILSKLAGVDAKTRSALLDLLSVQAGNAAMPVLQRLADPANPGQAAPILKTAGRMEPKHALNFDFNAFLSSALPEVRAYAVCGLYRRNPEKYGRTIRTWLASADTAECKAGMIAAAEAGESTFISPVKKVLTAGGRKDLIPIALKGLHRLGAEDLNALALPYFANPQKSLRAAALAVFEIDGANTLKAVIALMGDPSAAIRKQAREKIDTADYHHGQILIEHLGMPKRTLREGIFKLLESLDIKDLDTFRFAQAQIQAAYVHLAEAEGLKNMPQSARRDLLIDHLDQKRQEKLENTLRVLSAQDRSGKLRIICRGLFSNDTRQKANSLEALENLLDRALTKTLLPLVEESSMAHLLTAGRKHFKLPQFGIDPAAIFSYFIEQKDGVTITLTLYLAADEPHHAIDPQTLETLAASKNTAVRQGARRLLSNLNAHLDSKEKGMETRITIADKILHLKGIELFRGLSVSEFIAVASVTEETVFPANEIVIQEGQPGETMYMIVSGEVSVTKRKDPDQEIELAKISAGDYFGEMALVDDVVRSASVRTESESRLLVLHKQEFKEIVREYPQIALQICKVLSGRIRKLHQKIKT